MPIPIPKRKRYENKAILKACKDPEMTCQVQLPGCLGAGAPTVPAHSNCSDDGKGKGIKADDIFVAAACQHCHDVLDGRKRQEVYSYTVGQNSPMLPSELQWYHDRGIKRTIRIMIDRGILK